MEKISGVAGRYWLRCARGGPMKVYHVAYGKVGTNLTLKLKTLKDELSMWPAPTPEEGPQVPDLPAIFREGAGDPVGSRRVRLGREAEP